MTIKKFTMKEVDEEIMQIVQQQNVGPTGQTGQGGPPDIIKSIMNRVKARGNGKDGISQA